MILADTSVWVDQFRGEPRALALGALLEDGDVLMHPWVAGELLLGGLGPRRRAVLADLDRLPQAPVVADREVRELIEARQLSGRGIGWVDAQLLSSALVASARIWTFDRGLAAVARELKLLAEP